MGKIMTMRLFVDLPECNSAVTHCE